jgi:hypothetical protein
MEAARDFECGAVTCGKTEHFGLQRQQRSFEAPQSAVGQWRTHDKM